jgi:hypothetical protein
MRLVGALAGVQGGLPHAIGAGPPSPVGGVVPLLRKILSTRDPSSRPLIFSWCGPAASARPAVRVYPDKE